MDREKLIAQLAAAGEDREALNKLSDCALNALAGTAKPDAQNESELWSLLQDYKRRAEDLEKRYEPVVQNQEKERVRILDEVLSVQGRPWDDVECMNMKFEDLKKIHAALCQRPDFSGRGGPRSYSPNLLANEVKPFFGPNGVFGRKEN